MDLEAVTQAVAGRLFVELEASGRHVHLTRDQAQAIFGHGLTPSRPLSQPGQFLARERVTLVGPKGSFENVAVLGPERGEGQVEVSQTDARVLGVRAPVRPSGSVDGTPGMELRGPLGQVRLDRGVMVAQRHIHMTPQDAARYGLSDGQLVRLRTYTRRPLEFLEVLVRVSPKFATYVHLDYDEANACGFQPGDLGRLLP